MHYRLPHPVFCLAALILLAPHAGAQQVTLAGVSINKSIADRLGADPLGQRSLVAFAGGLRVAVGGGAAGTNVVAASAAGIAQAGAPNVSQVTAHLTWPEVTLPTPTGRERTSVKSYVIYRYDLTSGAAGVWRQVASVPATQHQADVPVTVSPAVNALLSVGLELQTLTFSTGTEPANGPVVNVPNGTSAIAEVSNLVRIVTP